MTTDLERLRDVISGKRTDRRCGKTHARCHHLAWVILLGEHDTIIVMISHERDINYIKPILIGVLDEYGISHEPMGRLKMKCNSKTIMFMAHLDEKGNEYRTKGIRANYVPMRHWD